MFTILVISIILMISIYYLLKWLYNEYKNDLKDIDYNIIELQKQLIELKKKVKVQQQLINWLYDNKEVDKK